MKHILISRTDNLGDVILTLPFAYYCKKFFPNSKISFLGKSYTQPILELCPWIDQIYLWDEWQKLSDDELVSFVKALKIDVVYHVFPLRRIAKIMYLAKIKVRVGTANRLFHWPMTCNKKIYFSRKRSDLHESQLNLKLLNSVSHSLSDLDEISTELLRRPALREVANSFLSKTRPNLIIHPKSQGSAQEWGNANFINFTNELVKLDFCHIMITGTKAEGELLAKDFFPHLSDEAKMKIKNTCGLLSLKELIELISHAQMIMANSTGPLHLGSLFGLKTVGLFPGDDQRPMHAGRWRPIGLNVSIFKPLNGQHLQTVSPEVVIGKIKQWECK